METVTLARSRAVALATQILADGHGRGMNAVYFLDPDGGFIRLGPVEQHFWLAHEAGYVVAHPVDSPRLFGVADHQLVPHRLSPRPARSLDAWSQV